MPCERQSEPTLRLTHTSTTASRQPCHTDTPKRPSPRCRAHPCVLTRRLRGGVGWTRTLPPMPGARSQVNRSRARYATPREAAPLRDAARDTGSGGASSPSHARAATGTREVLLLGWAGIDQSRDGMNSLAPPPPLFARPVTDGPKSDAPPVHTERGRSTQRHRSC